MGEEEGMMGMSGGGKGNGENGWERRREWWEWVGEEKGMMGMGGRGGGNDENGWERSRG